MTQACGYDVTAHRAGDPCRDHDLTMGNDEGKDEKEKEQLDPNAASTAGNGESGTCSKVRSCKRFQVC